MIPPPTKEFLKSLGTIEIAEDIDIDCTCPAVSEKDEVMISMALSHKKQHNIVSPDLRDTYFTKEESTRLVTLSVRIARESVNISSSDRTTEEELQEFKLLSGK